MWAVFKKAFRDSRKSTIWLSIGLGLYALFMVSFYPALVEQADVYQKMIESYPEEMLTMFYGGDVDLDNFDLTDPGTFLQSYFTIYTLLILGAVAIVQSFNAITNAERDGTLDLLLSLPVSRRKVLIARFASTAVGVLIVLTVMIGALWLATLIWPEFEMSMTDLIPALYGAFLLIMVFTSLAYLLAVFVPSSKHFAGAVAYLAMIGTYLVYGLSGTTDALKDIKPLIAYDYYNAAEIIHHGVELGNWALLALIVVAQMGLAWWWIDRKELAV